VYLVESYWDREKQQARQKRTYVGRKDEKTGEVESTQKTSLPKQSRGFGGVFLLKKVIEETKVHLPLKTIFPLTYERMLYLAMFKLLTADPYYLYSCWAEDSVLPDHARMDHQRISELLIELGEDEAAIERFFAEWISLNQGNKAVMLDITSISSYSEHNPLLETGYNRDREDLEQVNLGIVSKEFARSLHVPLAYRVYAGSINDVSTLKNVLELVDHYHLLLSVCVLDRGFYSQENIKRLHEKRLNFIVPVPFSTSLAKQAAAEVLGTSQQSLSFNHKIYFHMEKSVSVNGVKCNMHMFLDKGKRAKEEAKLLSKCQELETAFSHKKFRSELLATRYVEETLRSKKQFFQLSRKRGRYVLGRNTKAIEAELSLFGAFILLTNNPALDRLQVLDLYRRKDGAEKIFQSFKNDLREKRSRAKSAASMKGRLFISFLALILLAKITQTMQHHKLFQRFSKQELFKIVSALKVFTLANNISLLAEVTKKQKTIFSAFSITKLDPS
jgi:transposase